MGHLGITQDVTVTPSGPSPPSPLGVSPNTTLLTNVRRPQKETADNPPHPSPLSHILPLPGIASLIWSLYSNACWSGDMWITTSHPIAIQYVAEHLPWYWYYPRQNMGVWCVFLDHSEVRREGRAGELLIVRDMRGSPAAITPLQRHLKGSHPSKANHTLVQFP